MYVARKGNFSFQRNYTVWNNETDSKHATVHIQQLSRLSGNLLNRDLPHRGVVRIRLDQINMAFAFDDQIAVRRIDTYRGCTKKGN